MKLLFQRQTLMNPLSGKHCKILNFSELKKFCSLKGIKLK